MKQFGINASMLRLMCLIFLVCTFMFANGQSSMGGIERADYLSNFAKKYLEEGNYNKAVDYEQQSMNIIGTIYGENSIEYASSAIILSHYMYLRGCYGSSNKELADNSFGMAIKNLKIAMTFYNAVLYGFEKLNPKEKYLLWQKVCPLYDRLFPCYVAKFPTDSLVADLYNSVLFSKGATWRHKGDAKKTDWREIQRAINPNDLVIEFISPVDLDEENIIFYALLLTSSKPPRMLKLFDIIQLNKVLGNAESKFEKDLEIGKLIWGNLKKELNGIDNVYFSASHVFHNIPFEYSPIDINSYYSEKFNMYRLSSTLELTSHRNRPQYNTAVLYGGLEYDSYTRNNVGRFVSRAGLERLYNTDVEVDEISKILRNRNIKCTLLKGAEGTESSFRNLPGKSIDILHLSTHGKSERVVDSVKYSTEDNALLHSYLALSGANKSLMYPSTDKKDDGIITALDITQMNFNSIDVVCMSACESALGTYSDDDGILGLQKGFKVAGANTLLMSLGKVDDEATRILMVEFYRNLMDGKTKLQSLRNAQKYLRNVENGKYDDPKYWASFIMLDGIN